MKHELENIIEKYDVQTNDDVQFRKDLLELLNKKICCTSIQVLINISKQQSKRFGWHRILSKDWKGRIIENVQMFNENDWNHFHDCLFDLTGKSYNRKEMEDLFYSLPRGIQSDAKLGMSKPVWLNTIKYWFKDKIDNNGKYTPVYR